MESKQVYVSNLPANVFEEDIAGLFGSIGVLAVDKRSKKAKIWLYRDKETGSLKGDGTVTYDDPEAAKAAVSWFNNYDFNGSNLHVSLAQRKVRPRMQNMSANGGAVTDAPRLLGLDSGCGWILRATSTTAYV